MSKSRTKNVSINMVVGLFCHGLSMIMQFVARTVFIKTLGADYLGVNGLFSNVLSILSFAELGIGSAIVYNLYKPIATDDKGKINSLIDLYKTCYRVIGIFIASAGVCLIPFLDIIIKNKPNIPENLVLLYALFLGDTIISYFFVYKRSVFSANQKKYITTILDEVINLLRIAVQTVFLYLTHNYIIYLLLQILGTLLRNVIASVLANRMYPYLKEEAVPLKAGERKAIFKDVRALAMYKFGSMALNSTDNILVSALVGVREVGLVSNYTILTTSCRAIFSKITEAFVASVGNLNAISEDKKKYEVFNKMFLIVAWLSGFVSVGLATVANPLITVWIGGDYLLSQITCIAIVSETYFKCIQFVTQTYRTTLGLFVQSRFVPIWSAIINIILSILLCKWIGLPGIFFATSIARTLGVGITDPYWVFKKTFHRNPMIYWIKFIGYTLLFVAIGIICNAAVTHITISGWLGVITQIFTVTVIFNGIMLLVFGRTKAFTGIAEQFAYMLKYKKTK